MSFANKVDLVYAVFALVVILIYIVNKNINK